MGKIFSPGKLMLTSEYFAIDGALVLAVPTKLGQEFFFEEIQDSRSLISWNAFHEGELWLSATINYHTWDIIDCNLPQPTEFILKVLKNVQAKSSKVFQSNSSYQLKTNLQFPANFGLGSSSTLMANLAEWAKIDAFELNEDSLGGSGYDIAVAKEKSAVLYQRFPERNYEKVTFEPLFKDELIFIHLNQKQYSREGISLYKSKEKSPALIQEFTDLTKKIFAASDLQSFSQFMDLHEDKISNFLKIPTVKQKFFKDCPSFVKSLGAWGGDFVMSSKFEGYQSYFSDKGFDTIFSWNDIID